MIEMVIQIRFSMVIQIRDKNKNMVNYKTANRVDVMYFVNYLTSPLRVTLLLITSLVTALCTPAVCMGGRNSTKMALFGSNAETLSAMCTMFGSSS